MLQKNELERLNVILTEGDSVIQYQMVLNQIQNLSALRHLDIRNLNAALKTNVDILNSSLTR